MALGLGMKGGSLMKSLVSYLFPLKYFFSYFYFFFLKKGLAVLFFFKSPLNTISERGGGASVQNLEEANGNGKKHISCFVFVLSLSSILFAVSLKSYWFIKQPDSGI